MYNILACRADSKISVDLGKPTVMNPYLPDNPPKTATAPGTVKILAHIFVLNLPMCIDTVITFESLLVFKPKNIVQKESITTKNIITKLSGRQKESMLELEAELGNVSNACEIEDKT